MRFGFVGRTRRSRRIRHFTALLGDTSLVEDPVTGNANGPMGAWLVHH
ncbi:PhzF family phenazine biosynthesis protein, partial [Escherichia coli]|nr:PhzF family phenazine biosynthesis protein [Escherichia coli]